MRGAGAGDGDGGVYRGSLLGAGVGGMDRSLLPVRGRTMGGSIVNGGLAPSDELRGVLLPPAVGNLFHSGDV